MAIDASASLRQTSQAGSHLLRLLNAPLAWIAWIYVLCIAVLVPLALWDTARETALWWDLVDLCVTSVAATQWWRIARGNRDEVGVAARFITAGIVSWLASEVIWVICDFLRSPAAEFPSPATFGFVAFLPLFGLGLVLYIQRAVRRWFTTPLLCDLGVVSAALIVVVGFPMNGLLHGADTSLDIRVTAIGFPVLGLMLAVFNLYCLVAFGWGARRWILVLLVLGGSLIVSADFLYAMGEVMPQLMLGGVINPFWSVGFGLISLAAFEHSRIQESGSAPPLEAIEHRLRRLRQFLPAAGLIAIVATVIGTAEHFSAEVGLTILLPAAILFAVSMAATSLWNRAHIADLQGKNDAANAAWRKAEARFGTLMEFSPDPILVVDRRGRIQAVGKGVENAFNLPRAALLRQPLSILSPDFEAVLPRPMLARLAAGKAAHEVRFEIQAQRRGGAAFPAEGVAFALEDDGHLIGLVLRDVTERRSVEQQLRAAKETAEIADRSKSEFLANMSHELRTPLNAIIGFGDLISSQAFGPGDPRYQGYAEDIAASGRHLLSLLKDILDFARIETRNAKLHEGECRLPELIDTCHRILHLRAQQADVKLWIALSEDLPELYGDAVKLKQVLLNLMSNAIKFTPEGGEVRVGAALMPDNGLAITIADTGIGMRPEDIPLAMAPFGQIARAFSRAHDGLGLGLPLANQLVELHGGRLEIASQPERGTVVTVLLPADRVIRPRPSLRLVAG